MLNLVFYKNDGADLISSPSHYISGRTIEPIEVIEQWGLCHHLACVVKYISRAGRKNSALKDLKKSEWYLIREIERCMGLDGKCQQHPSSSLFSSEEVATDWKLSLGLHGVLKHLEPSAFKDENQWVDSLCTALVFLRHELVSLTNKKGSNDNE